MTPEVIDHAREALLEIRGRCEDHDRPYRTIVQMVDRIAASALVEPSIVEQLKPYLEVAEKAREWRREETKSCASDDACRRQMGMSWTKLTALRAAVDKLK